MQKTANLYISVNKGDENMLWILVKRLQSLIGEFYLKPTVNIVYQNYHHESDKELILANTEILKSAGFINKFLHYNDGDGSFQSWILDVSKDNGENTYSIWQSCHIWPTVGLYKTIDGLLTIGYDQVVLSNSIDKMQVFANDLGTIMITIDDDNRFIFDASDKSQEEIIAWLRSEDANVPENVSIVEKQPIQPADDDPREFERRFAAILQKMPAWQMKSVRVRQNENKIIFDCPDETKIEIPIKNLLFNGIKDTFKIIDVATPYVNVNNQNNMPRVENVQ